jgi:hypothetical protein
MNKKTIMMLVSSAVLLPGCDEWEPRRPLVDNTPKQVAGPNPEDTLIGTVIATQSYTTRYSSDASSLFFIDTDGNKNTAEYVGRLQYSHVDYIQGAGQAFNAERTGMQKTITQWRQTLDCFQPIQKEKE